MPMSIARPPKVVTMRACMAAPAVRRARRVVPDEQVGEDRRQLPEDVEHEQVVGQDEAEHRAGEGGEDRGEAPQGRVVVARSTTCSRAARGRRRPVTSSASSHERVLRRKSRSSPSPGTHEKRCVGGLPSRTSVATVRASRKRSPGRGPGGGRPWCEGSGPTTERGRRQQVQEQQLRHGGPSVVGRSGQVVSANPMRPTGPGLPARGGRSRARASVRDRAQNVAKVSRARKNPCFPAVSTHVTP